MNIKKSFKSILLLLLVLGIMVFTGCDSGDNQEEEVYGDTLIVGMSLDNPPYGWTQEEETDDTMAIENSELFAAGYDVAIAKAIGEELDVDIVIRQIERDELIDEVEDGSVDLMISGVNPLESRADRIDFSDAYYENEYVIIVLKDGKYANETSIHGFKKAKITGKTDSYAYDELLPQMKHIELMDSLTFQTDMRVALSEGVVDGYIATYPEGMSATRLHPEYAMIAFEDEDGFETKEEYSTVAIGITKGREEFVNVINKALRSISDTKRFKLMEEAVYSEPDELGED